MTYEELYDKANRMLNNSEITIGEYEAMIEPLKAEIETGWISVEDRLPEEGVYLVTIGAFEETLNDGRKIVVGNPNWNTGVLGYGCCQRTISGEPIGFGWYDRTSAVYMDEKCVKAWMPLPAPYIAYNGGEQE